MAAEVTAVVDGYIAMWNETSAEARRAIIAETWSEDATYIDPLMSGQGAADLDAMVSGVQEQFPGHRFELTSGPDHHHDRVRFAWRLVGANGGPAVAHGVDFATLAADGRLRSVTGFLEPAASEE
jgi:SnoaL-like domain